MKALAIDTSNLVMGVAVISDNTIIGELNTNLKKNHSVRLMPAINDLLKEVDLKPNQLDRIIVAKGPGSYTGVRIGVSVAKTLAWALTIPLVGVSSLEVLAQNGKYFPGHVIPMFDARRTQVYTGIYQNNSGALSLIQEERVVLIKDLIQDLKKLTGRVMFIGNDVKLHKQLIKEEMGEQALIGDCVDNNPSAGELARLGVIKEAGENTHAFVPSYLQLAEAEAKWLANKQ